MWILRAKVNVLLAAPASDPWTESCNEHRLNPGNAEEWLHLARLWASTQLTHARYSRTRNMRNHQVKLVSEIAGNWKTVLVRSKEEGSRSDLSKSMYIKICMAE